MVYRGSAASRMNWNKIALIKPRRRGGRMKEILCDPTNGSGIVGRAARANIDLDRRLAELSRNGT